MNEDPCMVCGDTSFPAAKHFGVKTCNGCKAFFRRSVRNSFGYICRGDGNCEIDVRVRNACRYCRYKKCLSAGMNPNGVQNEKGPQQFPSRKLRSSQRRSQHSLQADQTTMPGAGNSRMPPAAVSQIRPIREPTLAERAREILSLVNAEQARLMKQIRAEREREQQKAERRKQRAKTRESSKQTPPPVITTPPVNTEKDMPKDRATALINHSASAVTASNAMASVDSAEMPVLTSACTEMTPQDNVEQMLTQSSSVTNEKVSDKQPEAARKPSRTKSSESTNFDGKEPSPSNQPDAPSTSKPTRPIKPSENGVNKSGNSSGGSNCAVITTTDLFEFMLEQLLTVYEFMKAMPEFTMLSRTDQVSVLQGYSAESILLGIAQKSSSFERLLFVEESGTVESATAFQDIGSRLLTEIINPIKSLNVDDAEQFFLKAIGFFNPYLCSPSSQALVQTKRDALIGLLTGHTQKTQSAAAASSRTSKLFLLNRKLERSAHLASEVNTFFKSLGNQLRNYVATKISQGLSVPSIDTIKKLLTRPTAAKSG